MINYYLDYSTHDIYSQNPFFVTLKARSETASVLLFSLDGYFPKIVSALAAEESGQKIFNVSSTDINNKGIYFSYRKSDPKIKNLETVSSFYVDTNFELGLDFLKTKIKNERHILTSITNIDKGLLNYISDSDVLNINLKCLRDKMLLQNLINAFPRYTTELQPLFNISENFFNNNSYIVLSNDKRQSKPKVITVVGFEIIDISNLSEAIENAPEETKRDSGEYLETNNFESILLSLKEEIKELVMDNQSFRLLEEELVSGDSLEIFRNRNRN